MLFRPINSLNVRDRERRYINSSASTCKVVQAERGAVVIMSSVLRLIKCIALCRVVEREGEYIMCMILCAFDILEEEL